MHTILETCMRSSLNAFIVLVWPQIRIAGTSEVARVVIVCACIKENLVRRFGVQNRCEYVTHLSNTKVMKKVSMLHSYTTLLLSVRT